MTNKRSTKRALIASFISMLLCFTMLMGTTYAWFTDSVESKNNIIKTGNLDVELEYYDGKTWVAVNEKTNVFTDQLWEPGHTEVVYLKVSNLGSLALKYNLGVNVASEVEGVSVEGNTIKLSDILEFDAIETQTAKFYDTRDDARNAVQNAKKLSAGYSKSNVLIPATETTPSVDYVALVVYMPEATGNEANYRGNAVPTINLGINLFASQTGYEGDSFGTDYDATASVTVAPGESIANAIKAVEDGGVVYLDTGVHNVASGPIVIEDKDVTIVGLGEVTINKNYGGTHIFTVKNGANVTIENVTMDGKGNTREGVYVRWSSVVTLENVTIKNTGGKDIMIDEASDAAHGEETASYVWLINSHIEDVAMCASPVTSVAATQDTFVYFNYDANSTVGSIDVQSINKKPENVIINGVASTEVGTTMQLYVKNDAELTAALETIKTNEAYWNKQVYVYMAAGEYSADHVINQYPQWNGIAGRGTGNNYQGGVPAGAPNTVITFVGETASTMSLRGAQTVPAVTFTGLVTVNGFADAQAGFATAIAVTTFENIAFTNTAKTIDLTAAASNISFSNCVFTGEYVTVGASGANRIGNVAFDGCTFNEACVSGYVDSLVSVKNSVVTDAPNGFINIQNSGDVNVENCTVNAGRYFVRTNGSNVDITVTDSDITVYESEGTKHLVYFRGSNETAEFTDCTIADGYTTEGVDANSSLEIYNFSETDDGFTLVTDGVTEEVTFYLVPAEYEGTTVTVPEGVDTIGGYAFAYNSNIEEIILPSTVTTLNDRAFRDTSASEVILNEGLTNISYQAFRNASNVTEVVIPSTVTTISKEAFQNSGITNLTIPANVTTIEYGGCRDMKELTTITIKGNVNIPAYAFRSCSKLETVYIEGTDVTFNNGMIFSHYDTGYVDYKELDEGEYVSKMTIHVANEEIKNRLYSADSTAKLAFNLKEMKGAYTIVCEQTADSNGVYTDETTGESYAYASNETTLATAIEGGADTVYLSSGEYIIPDSAKGKTLTIVGNGDTVVASQDDGAPEGDCDYSFDGATVTFENVTITTKTTYFPGYARMKGIYNNCTINGVYTLYDNSTFNNCTFNVSGDVYNVWTWGATEATFNGCTFNNDGKAVLLYGQVNTKLTLNDCVFNDNGGLTDKKAAVEIGNDYSKSYELIVNNATVNGYEINDKGINTGTTLWANKNSMGTDKLNVVVDGVDVY